MRRLKITQQLMIVLLIAVILPLCLAALIVTNVNQQAVRKELRYSARITADGVYQHLINCIEDKRSSVLFHAKIADHITTRDKLNKLLAEIVESSPDIERITIIEPSKLPKNILFAKSNIVVSSEILKNKLVFYAKLRYNKYLMEEISLDRIKHETFRYLFKDSRHVYVLDSGNKVIMSYNKGTRLINKLIPYFPKPEKFGQPVEFSPIKNQPNILINIEQPNWKIVVATPKTLTDYGIINARFKIIAVLLGAAVLILLGGLWYSVSLYTNIKQLIKAISALKKGNYNRRIRLIKDPLTPYEVIFLAEEFNEMAQKINETHINLQNANFQLSKLDKMKSDLIDTVSHEFRTPLTCIKGYTSRLLRSDISLDPEIKTQSLKVIKQQTERLSRLVDDLLVIPELESFNLRIVPDQIDLKAMIESCIFSIQQKQHSEIALSIDDNILNVYADPDRVEQILINLLDNAVKYSSENTEIYINVVQSDKFAIVEIKNQSEHIPDEVLNTLFEKFTRVDENLTRTTRGTGLGLFISKGLAEAMGGELSLTYNDAFIATLKLPLTTEFHEESIL
jgi:signal transduction histidine kinase